MKHLITAVLALFISVSAYAKDLSGPAPDFTLTNLKGEKVSLSSLKGKVVMINFWASWCGPCRQEMPLLEGIAKQYSKAGFELLGINLDEETSDAKAFLKGSPVTFPILLNPTMSVAELYKNTAMPSSYFIDKKGNLAHLHQGYRKGEEANYHKQIKKLLAQ